MIPQAYITQWSGAALWPTEVQIEQDLVLSRLIVGPRHSCRASICPTKSSALGSKAQPTYLHSLDELVSTKLRALYQRRKGRDLFDLWHVLVALEPDDARIVAGLGHYMRDDVFTYPQLAHNLKAKLEDHDFLRDIETLVTRTPHAYSPTVAADLVMERLGARPRNAPPPEEIANGAWRA